MQIFGHKLLQFFVIFTHLKWWVAVARHNLKWLKIKIINIYIALLELTAIFVLIKVDQIRIF